MATDDLTTPLGQTAPRKRRFRLPFTPLPMVAALLALPVLGFAGFAIFNDNPLGGEPIARVAITQPSAKTDDKGAAGHAQNAAKPASPASHGAPNGQQTVTIIDGSKGTRQEVAIGPGTDAPAAQDPGSSPSSPPAVMNGVDQRLLESARYGMVPVVAGGLKPSQAYAGGTDLLRTKASTMPAVAIVVTGLGVGAAKTSDATMRLPGAVTLAFTPYGTDPGKLVERARSQGHEVLMQVPMEPQDYPDNDPGPQALLTTLPADQNLDRLLWHMSRFQGYVGLANFMGARFLATDAALQPVLKEASKRGLVFLDDGTVGRSVAPTVAEGLAMPFSRADAVIDAVPTASEIDRTLAKLETLAKDRGVAVGVASALPVSIDRIAAWSKSLESRGVVLVPLTSAMLKAKSS